MGRVYYFTIFQGKDELGAGRPAPKDLAERRKKNGQSERKADHWLRSNQLPSQPAGLWMRAQPHRGKARLQLSLRPGEREPLRFLLRKAGKNFLNLTPLQTARWAVFCVGCLNLQVLHRRMRRKQSCSFMAGYEYYRIRGKTKKDL